MSPLYVFTRRVAWLVVIALVGGVLLAWIRRRDAPQLGDAPEWPPLEPDSAGAPSATWVEAPADGSVPDGHPIKVNTRSGVFHLPGGRFYDRTNAERFYATAEDAVADGYRQSKS